MSLIINPFFFAGALDLDALMGDTVSEDEAVEVLEVDGIWKSYLFVSTMP